MGSSPFLDQMNANKLQLHVRYCGVSGCPTEAGEGLSHHAVIVKVTLFVHSVRRQSVAPATITRLHMFFVVMKASSLLL